VSGELARCARAHPRHPAADRRARAANLARSPAIPGTGAEDRATELGDPVLGQVDIVEAQDLAGLDPTTHDGIVQGTDRHMAANFLEPRRLAANFEAAVAVLDPGARIESPLGDGDHSDPRVRSVVD